MTTQAVAAFGCTLTWNGTNLAELLTMSGPSLKVDAIDSSSFDSTSNFREFIAGMKDGGEIRLTANWYPGDTAGQKAFVDDAIAGTKRTVIITGPTGAPFSFTATGLVTSADFDEPHDNKLGFSATIKISGVPTFAVTASANLTTLTGIEENAGTALTFTPTFAGAKKDYDITINTASTWVKLTPTLAGATITIRTSVDGSEQTVSSGAQSGTISVTDAAVTTVTLYVKESGKVANIYHLYIYTA